MRKKDKQDFINSILETAAGGCTCDCHKEGTDIMHFQACCDRTYEKFRK